MPGADKCSAVRVEAKTVEYPTSESFQLKPSHYSCGFSKDGRIIGANLSVPYPREHAYYHDVPFRRSVDWYAPPILSDKDAPTLDYIRRKGRARSDGYVDQCCHPNEYPTEASEYKRECKKASHNNIESASKDLENQEGEVGLNEAGEKPSCEFTNPRKHLMQTDSSYKAWVQAQMEAQATRDRAQDELRKVPWDVKMVPGHHAPPILKTSNEAYGLHLDMRPKFPLVYPETGYKPEPAPVRVRYRRSNMSDHPPIPDHAFVVPPHELLSQDGRPLEGIYGAPYKPDSGGLGDFMRDVNPADYGLINLSDRAKGRLPTRTHDITHETVVSGEGVKPPAPGLPGFDPWTFRRSTVILGQVVGERRRGMTWPVYTATGLETNRSIPRYITMSCGYRGSDKPVEQVQVLANSPGGIYDKDASRWTRREHKALCQPKSRNFTGLSKLQSCHRDFVNPEYLRVPSGWKGDNHCDVVKCPPLPKDGALVNKD